MLDWRGHVAEATSANVFFVKDRILHTPLPDCFLNGITRQTVIELARTLDYQVLERTIVPTELGDFDECFLTGTAAQITPVQSIDQQRYRPGRACREFIAAYTSTVNA
jgi:branched-chain amino acid aminotransferase